LAVSGVSPFVLVALPGTLSIPRAWAWRAAMQGEVGHRGIIVARRLGEQPMSRYGVRKPVGAGSGRARRVFRRDNPGAGKFTPKIVLD